MSNREPLTLAHDWFPRPVPNNIVIGPRSWLYSSFAFLHYRSRRPCGLRVGHDTGLYHGTFFDLGPEGEVEIGDYCAVVGAIISSNRRVEIHDYAFIAHEVVLADTFAATPHEQDLNGGTIEAAEGASAASAGIVIGENCWIAARAVLLAGARIGRGAIVGAAAVVEGEVPEYAIAAGNPARVVGWVKPPTES